MFAQFGSICSCNYFVRLTVAPFLQIRKHSKYIYLPVTDMISKWLIFDSNIVQFLEIQICGI